MATIDIVWATEELDNPAAPVECSLDCTLWDEHNESCSKGWDKEVPYATQAGWSPVPTDDCPGPGTYELVRMDVKPLCNDTGCTCPDCWRNRDEAP